MSPASALANVQAATSEALLRSFLASAKKHADELLPNAATHFVDYRDWSYVVHVARVRLDTVCGVQA